MLRYVVMLRNFVTLLDDAMKRQTLHRLKFLAVRVICSYLGNEGKKWKVILLQFFLEKSKTKQNKVTQMF